MRVGTERLREGQEDEAQTVERALNIPLFREARYRDILRIFIRSYLHTDLPGGTILSPIRLARAWCISQFLHVVTPCFSLTRITGSTTRSIGGVTERPRKIPEEENHGVFAPRHMYTDLRMPRAHVTYIRKQNGDCVSFEENLFSKEIATARSTGDRGCGVADGRRLRALNRLDPSGKPHLHPWPSFAWQTEPSRQAHAWWNRRVASPTPSSECRQRFVLIWCKCM